MSEKKKNQLGMSPSTASGRLVKDIIWKFIVEAEQDMCHKCGEAMTRDTFSIEHIEPWLDSPDPIRLYFDLDNITFSHLSCNIKTARKPYKTGETLKERSARNARAVWSRLTKEEQQARRRDKYLRYGV